jgi:hypothetical protein
MWIAAQGGAAMSALSRRLKRALVLVSTLTLALSASACVSQARYDAALDRAEDARREASARDREVAAAHAREAQTAQELRALDLRLREAAGAQTYARQLEDVMANNAALALRIQRAEMALAELRTSRASEDEGARGPKSPSPPEDLDVRRTTPEARADALRDLLRTVQALVDSGQVKVTVRDGRVRFHLPRRIDETDPYGLPGEPRGTQTVAPAAPPPDRSRLF